MKLKIMLGGLLVAAVSLVGAVGAQAISLQSGQYVNQADRLDSSLYAAGSTVRVSNAVNGSVYCAGQSVEISGTVNGDVLCAGQTVTITGTVKGDLRVAGQTVIISGVVDGDANIFAQTLTITGSGSINRDLTWFGSIGTLLGTVGRDLLGAGEELTIGGTVGRNIELAADQLTLASSARVEGDLTYTSSNDAAIQSGATVVGNTTRKEPTEKPAPNMWGVQWASALYGFGALLATGVVLLLLAPRFMVVSSDVIVKRPWLMLGLGLLALIIPPSALFLLMTTIIGLPVALAGLSIWGGLLLISATIGTNALGHYIMSLMKWQVNWQSVVAFLLGAVVVTVLGLIPVVGGLAMLFVFLWGLGGLAQMIVWKLNRQHGKAPKAKGAA